MSDLTKSRGITGFLLGTIAGLVLVALGSLNLFTGVLPRRPSILDFGIPSGLLVCIWSGFFCRGHASVRILRLSGLAQVLIIVIGLWQAELRNRFEGDPVVQTLLWTAMAVGYPFLFGWLISGAKWVRSRRTTESVNGPPSCESCGYNLTGNVSGRCPECGAVIGVTRASGE